MKPTPNSTSTKRPVNITMRADIIADAKRFGLNISAITAVALEAAVKREKERRWLAENREAIAAHNEWVEANGLPLKPVWMQDGFEGF